ncbi:MAG: hypothetical protein KJ072_10315 [Verrucomicrobia bacterium]|nr:hypothetical protein [Verrucomicrobiota bacterium]
MIAGVMEAAPPDASWDRRFGIPGVHRPHAITLTQSNLVGAVFCSSTPFTGFSRLVSWDGTDWRWLSDEFEGSAYGWITTTTFGNGVLFVGGSFTNASGVAANNLAQLKGSIWSALGSGVNGPLNTSTFIENNLYVGGQFSAAGGHPVGNIARWDGSDWHGLAGGVNGPVHKILRYGTNICVFGDFTSASGIGATNVALWNGDEWQAVAPGVPRAIAVDGSDLYVAYLEAVTGHIRRWDGTAWRPVSQLTVAPACAAALPCPKITGMEVVSGELYISGYFTGINGVRANGVAKWTGTSWAAAGSGFRREGFVPDGGVTMTSDGHRLVACGAFDTASGRLANGIAEWDGTQWWALGEGHGLDSRVRRLQVTDASVLAAGTFESPTTPDLAGVGLWDGQQWTVLDGLEFGYGFASPVWSILDFSNTLHAIYAGRFIVRRDDTHWTTLGSANANPLERMPQIYTMCEFNGDLYVGGAFDALGDAQNNVAKWDGQRWTSLGSGVSGYVNQLLAFDGFLYVDGDFNLTSGPTLPAPVQWDGQRWSPVDGAIPGKITTKTGTGTNLFLAVSADSNGLQPTNFLVRWTESGWTHLGGVEGRVHSLCLHGGELYAGGTFTSIGGTQANHIGRWDGSSWLPLGSGIAGGTDVSVSSIVGLADELLVGGTFTTAGNQPSLNFAVWQIPHALAIRRTNGGLRLSWPVTGSNFVLESTEDALAENWSEVSPSPMPLDSEFVTTLPAAGPRQFYRLRHE